MIILKNHLTFIIDDPCKNVVQTLGLNAPTKLELHRDRAPMDSESAAFVSKAKLPRANNSCLFCRALQLQKN